MGDEYRKNMRMNSLVGARVVFNDVGKPAERGMDYFAGTGYLGLQSHPDVLEAAQQALQRYGFSTATSRGGYGEHPVYDELERAACAYFGAEKILYFASGYLGMSVLTQATCGLFDHIFLDTAAHFSLWDAAQASNMPITPFHHCRADSLDECLRRELHPGERPLVLSDGVFPVSGEIAPLPDYLEVLEAYGGRIYLDDAHAVGVLGRNGRGTLEYYEDFTGNPFGGSTCCDATSRVRTSATLAKALGGYGGVIWGSADWIDQIEKNSRICVGASPPPLVVAAASARALVIARTTPQLRQRLWANVTQARGGFRRLGWDVADTPVPVICLGARDGIRLGAIRDSLFEQGFAVEVVRSYSSTPPGGALRIAIFATHTPDQIDRLLEAVRRV
jgi:8-amino-7-oxononanoate synthase